MSQHLSPATLRTLAASLLSTLAVICFAVDTRAANLTNTAVTGNEFTAAFDVTKHTAFIESKFKLEDGETEGLLRSEVFSGKGDNEGIYAYLYQIVAPSQTAISELIIAGFGKDLITSAKVKNDNDTSIYLTDLGDDNKIDKFTQVGTIAPTRVFVSDLGLEGVLFDYAGTRIPAGGTGYIVGIFSKIKPTIVNELTINGRDPGPVEYYTAVPEPGSLGLLLLGTLAVGGIRAYRRLLRG